MDDLGKLGHRERGHAETVFPNEIFVVEEQFKRLQRVGDLDFQRNLPERVLSFFVQDFRSKQHIPVVLNYKVWVDLPHPVSILVDLRPYHSHEYHHLQTNPREAEEHLATVLLLVGEVPDHCLLPLLKGPNYIQCSAAYQIVLPKLLFIHHLEG